MKASVYNTKGKEVGSVELPESVFGAKRRDSLVAQVVTGMRANARMPYAHAKGRGEVRGGGRKPWKQKGTGRARHGSIRSPIWKGGGVAHGPKKEEVYTKKLNKRMKAEAMAAVMSEKFKKGRVLFVDALSFEAPKTKDARIALSGLSAVKGFEPLADRRKNAALILLGKYDGKVLKSFRNMGNVFVDEARNANPVDLLSYRYVIVADPESSVKALADRLSK